MKNTIKFLGIIALAAAIGFAFAACGDDNGDNGSSDPNNPFAGTWKNTSAGITLVCTNTNWTWTAGSDTFTGTYTRNGNDASFMVSGVGVGTATVNGNTMTGAVQGYGPFTVTRY